MTTTTQLARSYSYARKAYFTERIRNFICMYRISLRILTGKKYLQIKLKLLQKVNMNIWVVGTLSLDLKGYYKEIKSSEK